LRFGPTRSVAAVYCDNIDKNSGRTAIVAYNLDGLDIDLEGSAVQSAGLLIDVIVQLRKNGFLVTAAREAAQTPLNEYRHWQLSSHGIGFKPTRSPPK